MGRLRKTAAVVARVCEWTRKKKKKKLGLLRIIRECTERVPSF